MKDVVIVKDYEAMVIIVAVKKSLIVDLPFAVRFITWNVCGGKKGAPY